MESNSRPSQAGSASSTSSDHWTASVMVHGILQLPRYRNLAQPATGARMPSRDGPHAGCFPSPVAAPGCRRRLRHGRTCSSIYVRMHDVWHNHGRICTGGIIMVDAQAHGRSRIRAASAASQHARRLPSCQTSASGLGCLSNTCMHTCACKCKCKFK